MVQPLLAQSGRSRASSTTYFWPRIIGISQVVPTDEKSDDCAAYASVARPILMIGLGWTRAPKRENHPKNRRALAVSTIPECAVRATVTSASWYGHGRK
jgi:hypothetical protein